MPTASPSPPQSSARRPTPTADEFALTGPSRSPDPRFNAYRPDLADIALRHEVIASHYAQPVKRHVEHATTLRAGPSEDSGNLAELSAGEPFDLLDDSLGWAWGYAGADRQVGYVPSDSIA